MIRTRFHQPSLWTGILAEEVDDLWEPWMRTVDRLLDDEELIERVFEAQARRCLKSRTRGRKQTPAEVVRHYARPLLHAVAILTFRQQDEELIIKP